MSNIEKFVIEGIAHWAHVHEVNKLSDKFQLDLSIDAATKKKLSSLGITINNKEEEDDARGDYVTMKSTYPPRIVDSKKTPIGKSTLIGNGSKVKVLTHIYEWKFGKKSGKALGLDAVQVIDLVTFVDTQIDAFSEEDGYISSELDNMEVDEDFGEEKSESPKLSKSPF